VLSRGSIVLIVWSGTRGFESVGQAIARETEIKAWRREKKVALIIVSNPTWEDLATDWGKRVAIAYIPRAWGKQVPHR